MIVEQIIKLLEPSGTTFNPPKATKYCIFMKLKRVCLVKGTAHCQLCELVDGQSRDPYFSVEEYQPAAWPMTVWNSRGNPALALAPAVIFF